jgi:hypothetical protein
VTSPELELCSLLLELTASELELCASKLELAGALSLEQELTVSELELARVLSLELDSGMLLEPGAFVVLSPLHPAQKKAVVVSRTFFQCLRMFIFAPWCNIYS